MAAVCLFERNPYSGFSLPGQTSTGPRLCTGPNRFIGEEDSVTPVLESALERLPNDPKLLTLVSICRKASVAPDGAEKSLCQALEYADQSGPSGKC